MFERWEARHPLAAALAGTPPGLRLAAALQDSAVLDPAVLDPALLESAVLDPAVRTSAVLDSAVPRSAVLDGALLSWDPLADQDVRQVDDAALLEVVAGWERMISWASAAQAVALAEMSRRAVSSREVEFVGDEVAARLGVSRRSAELKVELATALLGAPVVHAALATGAIDVRKATVLTAETAHLEASVAEALHRRFVPQAFTATAPQLRSAIRRAEQSLDAAAAEKRHERARAERSVTLTPAPCSMAWLTAYLPADDAMKVMTAVDALAASCGPLDARGIDARRADALVDVMEGVLATGMGPDGPLPERQHRRPHLQVTAAASTLLGLDEAPGALAGYGPIPASMTRRIAARSTWRALLTDEQTGELVGRSSTTYRPSASVAGWVLDRDVTCTFPGCRVPAQRCDIDHIRPFDDGRPAADQTRVENLQALCRHHHRAKTHGSWAVERDPDQGVTRWRSPTGHGYERPAATAPPRRFLTPPPPGVRIDLAGPRGRGRPRAGSGPSAAQAPRPEPIRDVVGDGDRDVEGDPPF